MTSTTPLTSVLHAWRRETHPGTVGYAGYVADPELLWARQTPLSELSSADWTPAATLLETLASPPRLALLRSLLHQEPLDAAPADLQALEEAHLIIKTHRGDYRLAPQAVVPLLTILAAATNIATD